MLRWSYGILMYEILSAGAVPYANVASEDVIRIVENGDRLEQPLLCPVDMYAG